MADYTAPTRRHELLIYNTTSGIYLPCLEDLGHEEVGIDELSDVRVFFIYLIAAFIASWTGVLKLRLRLGCM